MIRDESLDDLLNVIKDYYKSDGTFDHSNHTCHCHSIEEIEDLKVERFSQQQHVLKRIQEVIDDKQKKVILIQAPTGFGKSWIALALAIKYGASILTSTVDLQEQYEDEFNLLTTVKGKTRYPCKQQHEQKDCSTGYCPPCEHNIDTSSDVRIDPEQEGEREGYPMLEEKFIHTHYNEESKKNELVSGTGISCYYWDAIERGKLASSAVYNYASYLYPLKNNPEKIPNREVLICDEAHDYDHYVSTLLEVTLDNAKAIELLDELDPDTQFTKHDQLLSFAGDAQDPEIMVDTDGTLLLTPNSRHPKQFTDEEKTRHVWSFIKILISRFEQKVKIYEECAEHTRRLLGKEHLKKHPELFCHKLDSKGKEHGFTIKRNCKGKQDPNTNYIQMLGHQKNCTAHRAYIKDNWYLDCKQHLEERCDRDHRIYNHENFVKMRNYISNLKTLDRALSDADTHGGLVGDRPEYVVLSPAPEIKIGPIITRWITTLLLNSHKTCTVFLSSTIDKEDFINITGIKEEFVEYIGGEELPMLIPVEHRRVILDKQSHRGYGGGWRLNSDKLEESEIWEGLMKVIGEILNRHSNVRGILMLTNYRQMQIMREMVDESDEFGDLRYPDLLNRFTFDGERVGFGETKKKHLDLHYHGDGNEMRFFDPDSTDYDPRLPICTEVDCENESKIYTKNSVIVTVKGTTGLNLPYDESRFQIILKAPYIREVKPGLDKRADYLTEKYPQRYFLQSAFKLVQYCGRSVRHIDDCAVTYVLDGSVDYMIRKQRERLPNWLLESYSQGIAGGYVDSSCMFPPN